jgi:regulator of sigma E protease
MYPAVSCIIADIAPNSPAAVARLQLRDEITAVNGQTFHHYAGIKDYIDEHPEKLTLSVRRGTNDFAVTVVPARPISPPDEKPRLGITWDGDGKTTLAHPGALEQVHSSLTAMADTFGALFAKKSGIKAQHLGGAVKIMEVYYRLFGADQGWRLALWFSVLMNVNLALLNMLPIPVLDGGHILLAIIEGVRRKPISSRVISIVQTGCAAAIIIFMLFIAFYDVQDLPWKRVKEQKAVFAPKSEK